MSAPQIPEEAVEAGARAAFEIRDDPYDDDEWEDLDSTDRELYECQSRAALAAALPHLHRDWLEGLLSKAEAGMYSESMAQRAFSFDAIPFLRAELAEGGDGGSPRIMGEDIWNEEDASDLKEQAEAETRKIGRRERYAIATVTIEEDQP